MNEKENLIVQKDMRLCMGTRFEVAHDAYLGSIEDMAETSNIRCF